MAVIGYGRVSTDQQELDAQLTALKAAGATSILSEKESGAKSDRRELAKAIAALKPGDTLLVTRLDRLARSTRDLLNILDAVAKTGANFKSTHDHWCDTTTPHGELMVTILASIATFERHLIKARTADGSARAKDRGVRFGRKEKLSRFQQLEAIEQRNNGERLRDIAKSYGVSHSTISRLKPLMRKAAPR